MALRAPRRSRINTPQHTGLNRHVSGFHLDHWPAPRAASKRPIKQVFQFAHLLNLHIKVDFLAPMGHSESPSFSLHHLLHCVGVSSVLPYSICSVLLKKQEGTDLIFHTTCETSMVLVRRITLCRTKCGQRRTGLGLLQTVPTFHLRPLFSLIKSS